MLHDLIRWNRGVVCHPIGSRVLLGWVKVIGRPSQIWIMILRYMLVLRLLAMVLLLLLLRWVHFGGSRGGFSFLGSDPKS
jgi:hypothetical protein